MSLWKKTKPDHVSGRVFNEHFLIVHGDDEGRDGRGDCPFFHGDDLSTACHVDRLCDTSTGSSHGTIDSAMGVVRTVSAAPSAPRRRGLERTMHHPLYRLW